MSLTRKPILANRNTSEYFQNVGHADLFEDASGQWWAAALAWRSGPEGKSYPMGRETVLTPVVWEREKWPIVAPVRGVQRGWYLPPSKDMPGDGAFLDDPDIVDFEPNTTIPHNFGFWRWPDTTAYAISPRGYPGTLRLTPSRASITAGWKNFTAASTYRTPPTSINEEVGVTAFLNQVQNINLGIIMLPDDNEMNSTISTLKPHFRFLVSGLGGDKKYFSKPSTTLVPQSWLQQAIRLTIRAENATHYTFYAASASKPREMHRLGQAPATVVTGGMGPFTGCQIGVYSTTNGGTGSAEAYISRWRYYNIAQEIGNGILVVSDAITSSIYLLSLRYILQLDNVDNKRDCLNIEQRVNK
ncbi:concanavalin A-like lectin/glucanase domain-containing protein [Thelonectria olida]|uniref:Concanavalin A-like lectin/glucanase domain-containing protein n=1 Tax=Thelonectria olida TaxID=1576542 RepID=A0A9P8VUG4_9HYPO|nr:concanavalin A-like lectin/glucanase domain-containing protein [Thelonectria olida]